MTERINRSIEELDRPRAELTPEEAEAQGGIAFVTRVNKASPILFSYQTGGLEDETVLNAAVLVKGE